MNALQTFTQSPTGRLLSVLTTGIVAFLDLVLAGALPRSIRPFADIFQGLGVELPWPTRWFLATNVLLLPLVFIALATFVIWKEFSQRELRRKFILTLRAFFATLAILGLVIIVLYLPLFTLVRKLAETK